MLDKNEKKKTFLLFILQASLALLDLVGVVFVGLVTYILTENKVPNILISLLPWTQNDLNFTIGATTIVATIFFVSRGVLAPMIFRYMGLKIAEISTKKSIKLTEEFFQQDLRIVESEKTQERVYTLGPAVLATINEGVASASILFSEMFLILILIGTLCFINVFLSLVCIFYFFVILFYMQKKISSKQSISRKLQIENGVNASDTFMEIYSNFREIKASKKLDFFLSEYSISRKKESIYSWNLQYLNLLPKYIFEMAFFIGATVIFIGTGVLTDSKSAVIQMTMFIASGSRIMPSLLRIQGALSTLRNLDSQLVRVNEMELIVKKQLSSISYTINDSTAIQIKNLVYSRSDSTSWNLEIDNLEILRGSKVAIVGPSGAGKTTFLELILGLLNPTAGLIEYSILRSKEKAGTLPKICYVSQHIALLNRSVIENIALGVDKPQINFSEVNESIEIAGADEFINNLPNGLNTIIGERGAFLSGGERQRVGLARAIYGKPDILFLDEATSALDSVTESKIGVMFEKLPSDLTTITIAHRLSTVQNSNRVIYLKNGRLIADGTFSEVRQLVPDFDVQSKLMGL